MKKRNVILHTAIASALLAMGVAAQAGGSLAPTAVNFATQNFGPTSTAALAIKPGSLSYTFNTPGGIVLNPGGAINLYFRLGNGALFTAAPVAGDFATSSIVTLGLTAGVPVLSTDKTTFVVPFSNATPANITIGVGATATWVPSGAVVNTVNTVLNTAGNTVGATASASVLAANANAATLPADIDGPAAASVTIATAASAITANVTAGGPTAETQKIDVTVSPSQTLLTAGVNAGPLSTTKVNFGSFKFTNVAGVKNAANTADYSVAANFTAAGTGAVATGNFAATAAGGLVLTSDAACATPLAAGSVSVQNTGKTTATWTGATTAASGVNTYVCMTVTGAAAIPVTTPTLTTSLTSTTATDAATAGSGTLYALNLNGASVDVRSYIPAAATGYATYMRVINTGTSSAPISVAVIDPVTGVAGASGVLGTLAAGAAKTYLAADVETALGTSLAAALRPRIRVSGPTSSLQVQSFMSSPSGVFSDMTGAQ